MLAAVQPLLAASQKALHQKADVPPVCCHCLSLHWPASTIRCLQCKMPARFQYYCEFLSSDSAMVKVSDKKLHCCMVQSCHFIAGSEKQTNQKAWMLMNTECTSKLCLCGTVPSHQMSLTAKVMLLVCPGMCKAERNLNMASEIQEPCWQIPLSKLG